MTSPRRFGQVLVVSAMVTAFLISATPAEAATITPTVFTDDVTLNGNCTLREAVMAANSNTGVDLCQAGSGIFTDTIVLAEGIYLLTILGGPVEEDPAADDLDLAGSLVIDGPAGGATIDQQASPRRLIEVLPSATVTMNDVTLTGGDPIPDGGAIFNRGTLTLQNVTVTGNSSVNGAGGILNTGSLALTNATLSGNQAGVDGGGLWQAPGSPAPSTTLSSVTVTGNRADWNDNATGDGGGLHATAGTITIRNSIVAGNFDSTVAGANVPDCSGSIASDGYNLIGTQTASCTVTGNTTGNLIGDPGLGPLASNGGSTRTHLPQPGSQVIDAGNPSGCTDGAAPLPTDQRGLARVDGDGDGILRCDIGSVEGPAVGPKFVSLKAKPRKVESGEKTRLTARVSPCAGHEGDLVDFYRKSKKIATKASNADCVAKHKVKVKATTRFRAVSPAQDLDHAEGVSKKVKVRVVAG